MYQLYAQIKLKVCMRATRRKIKIIKQNRETERKDLCISEGSSITRLREMTLGKRKEGTAADNFNANSRGGKEWKERMRQRLCS